MPAVAVAGKPATRKLLAAAGLTVIDTGVLVRLPLLADRVWVPAVFRVALKVPVPLFRVALVGNTACPSLLVNRTTPLYPVAVLPKGSLAITLKDWATPAVVVAGSPVSWIVLASAGVTLMPELVPVRLLLVESVTVSDRVPAVLKVAEKVAVPLLKVTLVGRTACPSLLVNRTVPVYPVAVLPKASLATAVKF